MKNSMKHIVKMAVLGVSFCAVPTMMAQDGTGADTPTPPPPAAAPRAIPGRPVRPTAAAAEQFDRAAEQLDAAQAELASAEARVSPWGIGGGTSSGRSLVVPKEDSDTKGIEECEEDLNVMARILEKAGGRRGEKG